MDDLLNEGKDDRKECTESSLIAVVLGKTVLKQKHKLLAASRQYTNALSTNLWNAEGMLLGSNFSGMQSMPDIPSQGCFNRNQATAPA